MNIKDFKAGKYLRHQGYKSFSPSLVDVPWIIDTSELTLLLSQADRKLKRAYEDKLDGIIPEEL